LAWLDRLEQMLGRCGLKGDSEDEQKAVDAYKDRFDELFRFVPEENGE